MSLSALAARVGQSCAVIVSGVFMMATQTTRPSSRLRSRLLLALRYPLSAQALEERFGRGVYRQLDLLRRQGEIVLVSRHPSVYQRRISA